MPIIKGTDNAKSAKIRHLRGKSPIMLMSDYSNVSLCQGEVFIITWLRRCGGVTLFPPYARTTAPLCAMEHLSMWGYLTPGTVLIRHYLNSPRHHADDTFLCGITWRSRWGGNRFTKMGGGTHPIYVLIRYYLN